MLKNLSVSLQSPDRDFLASQYTLDETSDWRLDFDGEIYTLNHCIDNLAMVLDFRRGHYRHRNSNPSKEPLAQAIKIKKKLPSTLIDTTPGVLKDSLMLASRGVRIVAIERNPILFVMVRQALSVMPKSPSIDYYFGDARTLLADHCAEIIYLDPMYPQPKNNKKGAKVKKDMQILHNIVGADSDASQLFTSAIQQPSRVVVKRPSYAESLSEICPSYVSQTDSTRFDVYLPPN